MLYINNIKGNIEGSKGSYSEYLINGSFHMIPFFALKYCKRDKEYNFFEINKESYIKLVCDLEKSLEDNNDNGGSSNGMSLKAE